MLRAAPRKAVHLLIVAQVEGHFPIAMGDAGQLQWVGTIVDVTHRKIMKMVTGMGAISSFGPAPGIGPFARIQRCSGSMARPAEAMFLEQLMSYRYFSGNDLAANLTESVVFGGAPVRSGW
jgi:hypothetical protein